MSGIVNDDGIRLTRMKKAGRALLSKRIALGEDGRPVSDGSPCAMTSGAATRVALDWWSPASDLAALILDLGPHEALVLGDHVAQDETIEIVKTAHATDDGCYGRNLETFKFRDGEPAAALLDFDQKGITENARARLEECGGFEGALASLIPSYPGLARVIRASTSAGLRNEETGETFPGNGGQHVYLFVRDGADIPRFLHDLQKRAWLDGLGWIMVSSRGALLVRSIVDVTVGSPERLVFEGMPMVVAPLVQDQEARRPVAHEGDILDTASACPPLTPEEERQYAELVDAAKREKQPEVETAKEAAAEAISKLRSIDIEKARAVVAASTQGELWSWDVLHFDDEAIGEIVRRRRAGRSRAVPRRDPGRPARGQELRARQGAALLERQQLGHHQQLRARRLRVRRAPRRRLHRGEGRGRRRGRAVRARRAHGARPRPRRRHARAPAQPRRQGRRRRQAGRRGRRSRTQPQKPNDQPQLPQRARRATVKRSKPAREALILRRRRAARATPRHRGEAAHTNERGPGRRSSRAARRPR